jgi:hypothetical protein
VATAAVSVSTSGDNTIVSAAGATIVVTGWALLGAAAVNIQMKDSFGNVYMAPQALSTVDAVQDGDREYGIPVTPAYTSQSFQCAPGADLILNLSGAVLVTGSVDYFTR